MFEFYLALKLGRTVDELRAGITQAEMVHWGVYFGLEAQQQELARKKAEGRSAR